MDSAEQKLTKFQVLWEEEVSFLFNYKQKKKVKVTIVSSTFLEN